MAGELEHSDLRASDADRNAVAQRLQVAVEEGRLTISDYDERLQQTYRSRTYGELAQVTADLPATPAAALPAVRDDAAATFRREQAGEWRSWAGTAILLVTIWGITSVAAGGALFFWPMFPIGIWGAILLAQLVSGASRTSEESKDD